MSRLGPTGLTQLLTNIKTWVTTKLGNYVTTDTTQTVTGKKLFTASSIQLDNVTSMSGSTMFIDTSASAPRGAFPAEDHRVGRIYIGDSTSYNGAWFIVDPIINTNKAVYRMVTTNPDNTDSTRFSITWDSTETGARCRKNVSTGDLLPYANNTYNLGSNNQKWDIGYIHNLIGSNKEGLTEDANSYYSTTSGSHMTFYTTSNGGTKLSNVPAAVNTHLESRTIRYLSSSDWIIEQICHNSFGLYYRKGTNGTWEDWKTFAFTNSNITGTAANVTGTVDIANGGTGATTRLNAVKALTNEAVASPTHFLAITTNWGKAGYTTVAQAKTVLGITGDIGSHSDSEYVHKTGDETVGGNKTFSSNIAINGTYLGTEASTNERTNIYLLANRDTAGTSGAYIGRFRQNRTQGAMESSDVSFISFDFLENSTRYTRCFTMGLIDWDSNGVPQTYYLTSPDGKGSLGTATTAWNKVYANSYYLGTTSFTDKFVTTDTAQTITGVKTFNSDTLVANQGNAYRIANSAGTGYGVFQRTDGTYWYMLVTANNDPLGTWTSARPITIRLSDGYCCINGKANEANKVQATIAAGTTAALVQASVASNDVFRIAAGGAANAGWAEIATGDDANEPIYVRQYKGAFATLQRTATLLDGSGNTSFPGTVTATGFSGPLTGDVTGTASKATGNANGNEITDTVIKGLSISGKTITYTKIDGNTGTLTTQDTVYTHPTTSGNKHIPSGGSSGQFLGWDSDGTAKWVNNPNTNTDTLMTQNVSTTDSTYPILLCATANATSNQGAKTGIFGSGVKVNPKTSVVSAKGFSGVPTGNTYVSAVKDGGALVNSQATSWGAIWRAPTKDYQVAGATWSNNNNNVYICYSVTNANAEAGTNTMAKSLIWAADTGTLTTTTFSGALSGNASSATEFSANKDVTLTGDVTGTASSKAGWSVATTLANSGVTAGTYGPSEDVTGNNNTTISVPQITVDAKGRVTSVTNRTLTCKNNTYNVYDKTLTIQKNGTNVATFTSNSNTDVTANITVPTKVSELTNDSGYLTAHQSLANYVTLNSAQTISGVKTFTAEPVISKGYPAFIIKNTSAETTVYPSSGNIDTRMNFTDKNGHNLGSVLHRTEPSKSAMYLRAFNFNRTDSENNWADISIGYDNSGNVYTYAPTPASLDNSTKIATTAFVYNTAAKHLAAYTYIYVAKVATGNGSGSNTSNYMALADLRTYLATIHMHSSTSDMNGSYTLQILFKAGDSFGNATFDATKMPGVRNLILNTSAGTNSTVDNYSTNSPTFGNITVTGDIVVTMRNLNCTGRISSQYGAYVNIDTYMGISSLQATNYGYLNVTKNMVINVCDAHADYFCLATNNGILSMWPGATITINFRQQCYYTRSLFMAASNGTAWIGYSSFKLTGTEPMAVWGGSGTLTGTSETAAATVEKAVTLASGQTFTLAKNATAKVKFTVDNTANNPTLNIGGTGAKPIYWNNAPVQATMLMKNITYDVKYNGSQFVIQNAVKRLTNNDFGVFRSSGNYNQTYNSGSWNFTGWALYYGTGIENSNWRGSHIGNIQQNVSTVNNTFPVLISGTANATANTLIAPYFAKGVKINPSTNVVSASGFDGPLTWSGTAFSYIAGNSLYYYSGQPAIANCFEGSSNDFTKFSYPAGGTSVSSSNANIQTLRLDWGNTYWHDLFMSPNNNYLWHRNVVNSDARGWRRIVEENVTGLTDQSWNINIAGTAANVTGTVDIANGGTGATTRLNAVKALTNEAVASPTHFLAITTNWGKAGYTTVAQAKTVLGITGDIVSHNASEFLTSHQSLSNYVTLDGTQTIAGTKTFSSTISGSISGNAGTATQFSANTTVALTGDATGTSAGSKKGWSVPVTLANSGVTAGDYGPSADASPAHSGTFTVPSITVDAKGRITAASTKTITLPADNNTDTKVTQTVTNDNAWYPLLIANTASASHTGSEPTTETDEVRKAYNINVQARYGFIYARNSYTADNLKGSVAGGNRTSAAFYGSTYDGAIVGGVELGRVDKYGNRYSRLYATNYITDGALAPDGTAVATTFDVGVLADGTKYLNTGAGWYCNVYPTANNTRTLGTSSLRWKECYSNAYYLGTTAFGDIVTHNASEFLTSHQSLSSCVKNVVTNNQTIKSTGIKRGTAPSSAQTFGIAFSDNNDKYIGNVYGQYATDKSTYVGLYAYKGSTTSNGDNAYLRVGYDASGNVYTSAPTPATTDNSTQIATTAFVKAQGYLTSHQSLANYVTTNTDQSISGIKSHSKHISILGDYVGNEASTNGRSCLYLKANRDTDGKSGLYVTKFRQNRAQGSMGNSDSVFLSHDILENETRTNAGFVESYSNWENDVPKSITVYSTIETRNLGTSAKPWTNTYAVNFYENGTALSSKYALNENFGKGTTTYLYIKSADFPTGSGSTASIQYNDVVDGTKLYVWHSVCNTSQILDITPAAAKVTPATGQVWRYLGTTIHAVGLGHDSASPTGILGLFRRES